MRESIEKAPGVGYYNAYRHEFDKRGSKWVLPKNQSKSDINIKLPPVGTYNPSPVSFSLF
jgi:hypothetical protein